MKLFEKEVEQRIIENSDNKVLKTTAMEFMKASTNPKYSYNFYWLGRPIIQYPQDIVAMQEIIWRVRPELIIETGVAHGGSLVFYAAMLEINAICGGPENARVLGIDIEIRKHNREAIESHPLFHRIELIEGSSTSMEVITKAREYATGKKCVLVVLDSNHTHDHVFNELQFYAPLTTVGSYCVVFDTIIEDMPKNFFPDRPWSIDNNPKTAVWEYLKSHSEFQVDKSIENKLLITVAPDGYLKKVR